MTLPVLQEESIQSDLQQVVNSKSMLDEIKSRFSELLAFVEEEDDYSDEENVSEKNTTNMRVLRNLDSRRYSSDKKTFEESNYHKSTTKRHLFNGPDSSSEDDSDTDVNTRKTHYPCRSKRRLMIAD